MRFISVDIFSSLLEKYALLWVLFLFTLNSFKEDKEDTGEMSKREMSKLALTDALKFKYSYFLGLLY